LRYEELAMSVGRVWRRMPRYRCATADESKKREHHFRDTLFCVVPPGIVIHFQVVEYHYFLKATQL